MVKSNLSTQTSNTKAAFIGRGRRIPKTFHLLLICWFVVLGFGFTIFFGMINAPFSQTEPDIVLNQTPKAFASISPISRAAPLTVILPQSEGITYYVSTSGTDSNPGTEVEPFKTIQRAADIVRPGDTVIVEDGVYRGITPQKACYRGDKPIVCIHRGGINNNWVRFKSRNRWGAKLDGQNNLAATGFAFGGKAGYVRIEGFEIFGLGQEGSASGITTLNGSSDIQIIGNKIHDIGKLCTGTTNGEVGIFMKNPEGNILVEGNIFHDIGRFAPGENGCTPPNHYYKNHDHGIYNDGTPDAMVRNNIFYNINRGWAIQIYPRPVARMSIINNTFSTPNPYMDGHIVIDSRLTDSHIGNNIFYKPRNAMFHFDDKSSSGNVVTNNLTTVGAIFGGGLSRSLYIPGFAMVNNKLNTDPMFVGQFNFRLKPGSPAIDAGQRLPEVASDIEGYVRPQGRGYDIGAYEYHESSALPVPLQPRNKKQTRP